MLQGYYCDDPEAMYPNYNNDPEFNDWVHFDEAAELQTENEKLKGIILLFDNYCRVNDIDMEQFLNQNNNQSNTETTGNSEQS